MRLEPRAPAPCPCRVCAFLLFSRTPAMAARSALPTSALSSLEAMLHSLMRGSGGGAMGDDDDDTPINDTLASPPPPLPARPTPRGRHPSRPRLRVRVQATGPWEPPPLPSSPSPSPSPSRSPIEVPSFNSLPFLIDVISIAPHRPGHDWLF